MFNLQNFAMVIEYLAIFVANVLLALVLEKIANKRKGVKEKTLATKKIVVIGMFSALSAILMLFEIPLFFAPEFYKLDLSELPILIVSFAFGPVSGVLCELIKIVLKVIIKGTSTAFIGELANFVVGCSFILPASVIYYFKKTKKRAVISVVVGTASLTLFGTMFNAFYLLPAFAKLFHMDLQVILEMGMKVNPLVKSLNIWNFVFACVAPLNLLKGVVVSTIALFIYKPLSPIIKSNK